VSLTLNKHTQHTEHTTDAIEMWF